MKIMKAKEFVLQKHPELTIEKQYSEGRYKETSEWVVAYRALHTYEEFGRAKTQSKAWVQAKNKIIKSLGK